MKDVNGTAVAAATAVAALPAVTAAGPSGQPVSPDGLRELILELVGVQKAVYDELLERAQAKREAIVQGDIARLDAAIAAEEYLLIRLGSLEQQRERLIETLAGELGDPPGQLSLSAIAWRDKGQRERMRALQAAFGRTLDSVRQVNEVNAQLLDMHLAYVQEMLDAATQTVSTPTYCIDGSPESRRMQSARLYDRIL